MSTSPYAFSNVPDWVLNEISNRKDNPLSVNGLNAWVRVASGVDAGLALYSNPDFAIFNAAGDRGAATIYGNNTSSGTVGIKWDGSPYTVFGDTPYKPKPNITGIEIDEGGMGSTIARKAKFTVTAYTLGQLNELSKFFLEPGFTVFLEWGWNRPDSVVGFGELNKDYVSDTQSYVHRNNRRKQTKGMYDSYLGYITGGDVSLNGSSWDINVQLTGFSELPMYFLAADNIKVDGVDGQTTTDSGEDQALTFDPAEISSAADLGKKRFMMMYNQLPSNRRTALVKTLIENSEIANVVNFINFDDSVRDAINTSTAGSFFGLLGNKVKVGGTSYDIPSGTELIGPDKFIRFGTLMEIINKIGAISYQIGNKTIKMQINSKNTACRAFPRIFSADKKKLFIPNEKTPKFDLEEALKTKQPQATYKDNFPNQVIYGGTKVMFPNAGDISGGVASGKQLIYTDGNIVGIDVKSGYWGFLDDLYVNFDFAKGILETKNFLIKDAVYQILNGMASAAGGLWDFQILETDTVDGKETELTIVDMNLTNEKYEPPIATFDVYGVNSIFMDASLDFTISGNRMGQVVGNRLNSVTNGSQTSTKGQLFATGLKDQILDKINFDQAAAKGVVDKTTKPATGGSGNTKEEEKIKEKNLQIFLNKIGIFPKVELTKDSDLTSIDKISYISSLDDLALFESIKIGSDYIKNKSTATTGGTSVLFDIEFSFTIHGISGMKCGDKFKVIGIPKGYETGGFFQIISIKHNIQDMTWKTEVTGKFRINQTKSP
jgi:hypothetical protein